MQFARGLRMTNTITPFLKWAGGKTWLAPKLAEMFEPYQESHTWVEPFCGGLGATLGVMPKKAILSDVNPALINLYKQIGNGLENKGSFDISEVEYYRTRARFNNYQFSAIDFYYLNRVGYRGLCRTNARGEFNTPYGHYKKPKLDHDFSLYQKAFDGWGFCDSNYYDVLDWVKLWKTDSHRQHFVYADPPYDAGFTGYSGAFDWTDQVKLALALASLDCPVIASNKATDRIIELYKSLDFLIEYVEAPRRISCNGDRKPATEMLATKNI